MLGILAGILAYTFVLITVPLPILSVLRELLLLCFLTALVLLIGPPYLFCSGLFVFGLITMKPDKFVWHHILLILPAVPSIFVLFWAALSSEVGSDTQLSHVNYMKDLNQVLTYTTLLFEATVLSAIRLLGVKGRPFLFAIFVGIFKMGLACVVGIIAAPKLFTIVP